MATQKKIDVKKDVRVRRCTEKLNEKSYSYLEGNFEAAAKRGSIFLFHGFPDLAMGWRYQIPALLDLGFHVIALDCLGYGETDAPEAVDPYTYKSLAKDVKDIAAKLDIKTSVACGHDWGANLAYRLALWYPSLISHVITVCVPYLPSRGDFIPLESLTRTIIPSFAYQTQFESGQLEKAFQTKNEIRSFLVAMFAGRDEQGNLAWDAYTGLDIDRVKRSLTPSQLVTDEEMDYYVESFARHGLTAPLNYYRTRELNHADETGSLNGSIIEKPVLFIQALQDQALPPHLANGMPQFVPQLTVRQVDTTHWALWEKPEEVNSIISEWLASFSSPTDEHPE